MKQKLNFEIGIEISSGDKEEGKKPPLILNALAVTPGPLRNMLIVDLESMNVPEGKFPALFNHDQSDILGTFMKSGLNTETGLTLTGEVYPEAKRYDHIADFAARGFPWKASIGGLMDWEFLDPGMSTVVNGREVEGPMVIGRNYELVETSVCPCPFDRGTSVGVNMDDSSLTAIESLFNNALKEVTMKGNESPENKTVAGGDSGNKDKAVPTPLSADAVKLADLEARLDAMAKQNAQLAAQSAMAQTHAMFTANKLPVTEEHAVAFAAVCSLNEEARAAVVSYMTAVKESAAKESKASDLAGKVVGGFFSFGNPADAKAPSLDGELSEAALFNDDGVKKFLARISPDAAKKEGA